MTDGGVADGGLADQNIGRRFLSAATYSVLGGALAQALTLAGTFGMAKLLGSEVFGQFAMVQSTTAMVGALAGASLGVAATTHIPALRQQSPVRAGNVVALASLAALALGVLATTILFVAAPLLSARVFHDPSLGGWIRLSSGSVLFQAVNGAQIGSLAGLEAFRAIAGTNAVRGMFHVAVLVPATWLWGLRGALTTYVLSAALVCCINQVQLQRTCRWYGIRPARAHIWSERGLLTQVSLPTFLGSLLAVATTWLANSLLIRQPGGYAELGVYAAAERWKLAILFVPAGLASAVLPMLAGARQSSQRFQRFVATNVLVALAAAAIPALVVVALAGPIMAGLGEGFAGGRTILILLALCAVTMVVNNALGQALLTSGFAWGRLAVDGMLFLLLLGFSWWLIPLWGASGMAAAYLGAYLAAVAVLAVVTQFAIRRRGDEDPVVRDHGNLDPTGGRIHQSLDNTNPTAGKTSLPDDHLTRDNLTHDNQADDNQADDSGANDSGANDRRAELAGGVVDA